jgi:protein involved in polysaccharide export with SLBB domain
LNGGVLRPGTVELLPNEGLKQAVLYAGGFSTLADASRLTLSRLNGKSRTLYPLNFSGEIKEALPALQDGDEIYVFEQSEEAQNQVEVKGEVYFPGRYALTEGVGLKNILEQAGGITMEANTEKAFLIRRFTDGEVEYMPFSLDSVGLTNTILQDRDQVVIFKKEYFKDNFKVQIVGEVRNPQNIPYKEGLTIQTLIDYAGGLTSEANLEKAFLIRSYTNGEIEYLPFSLDSLGKTAIKLQARDKIVIFKKEYFKDNFKVEIRGEVRNPLSIPYTKGLSIQTLIDYAGGFNFKADVTEIEILRSNVFTKDFKTGERNKTIKIAVPFNKETNKLEDAVLQPEDIVVVRQISNLNDRIVVRVEGEWIHPGTYVLIRGESKVSDLIKFSGGLTPVADANSAQLYRKEGAQVVFDLRSVLRSKRSAFNYSLVDGDRLIVRVRPDVVYVPNTDTLVSKNQIIAPFISGKRAGYYMRNYTMSFDKNHLKRRLYVEYPGGQIKRARHYGLFVLTPKVKPGSTIKFQPSPLEKEEKPDLELKKETDWNRVIEGFTVKLTGIATLWILSLRI